jgi:hypothetical protein
VYSIFFCFLIYIKKQKNILYTIYSQKDKLFFNNFEGKNRINVTRSLDKKFDPYGNNKWDMYTNIPEYSCMIKDGNGEDDIIEYAFGLYDENIKKIKEKGLVAFSIINKHYCTRPLMEDVLIDYIKNRN